MELFIGKAEEINGHDSCQHKIQPQRPERIVEHVGPETQSVLGVSRFISSSELLL